MEQIAFALSSVNADTPASALTSATVQYSDYFGNANVAPNVPFGYVSDSYFKSDGTVLYLIGLNSQNVNIYEVNLSTAWDITTGSLGSPPQYFYVNGVGNGNDRMVGLWVSDDGTRYYTTGVDEDAIAQYTMSPAWSITGSAWVRSSAAVDLSPHSVALSPDGGNVYIGANDGARIKQYSLGTNWDVSTISSVYNLTSISNANGLYLSDDGSYIFVANNATHVITGYFMSTPFDLSTASVNSTLTGLDASMNGINFKTDGTVLYVNQSQYMQTFILSTPWDLSSI